MSKKGSNPPPPKGIKRPDPPPAPPRPGMYSSRCTCYDICSPYCQGDCGCEDCKGAYEAHLGI